MAGSQTSAFNLEITGSTETVKALELINNLIRENNQEMKALQKTGDATAKTIQNLTKENANLKKASENVDTELKEVNDRMKQLLATNKQASKEYKELKGRKLELVETEKKLTKELLANERQLSSNIDKNNKASEAVRKLTVEQEKNKLSATNLRKELKEQVKAFDQLNDNIPKDSIIGMGREVGRLTKQFELLSKAERETAQGKSLQKDIVEKKRAFDELNRSVGNFRSSVGDYRGAIAEAGAGLRKFGAFALGVFGVGSAMSVAASLFSNAKQSIVEFNQAIVDLGNDTTISKQNVQELVNIAIDLSGGRLGTKATDITGIFGFLANASPELANNVELMKEVAEQVNILSKAEKVNSEIVSGAVTTAAKDFNISLSDSAQIVDTLAHAADRGNAKLPQLAEAIKEGGVIAGQVGIPLKEYLDIIETTSKVGKPATETAGKLNKILAVLAKTGRDELNPALHPMSEILDTLDKEFGATAGSADALQKVTELFSSKNADFVLTLIQQKEVLRDLNGQQVENNGALEDAIKNAETLTGKTNEMKGEWDKFILSIDQGKGKLTEFFAFYTEAATGFIRLLRGEFRSAAQEELDNTLKEAFARGIKNSILGDLNANFEAAKAAAENLFKPLTDEAADADKTLSKFAHGTLGFISEEIERLNKILQNTTSETVISITTKQIFELEKASEALQLKIDTAKNKLSRGETGGVTAPIGTLPIGEIAFGQPGARPESELAIDFEQQQADAANRIREEDLAQRQLYFDAKFEQEKAYNQSVLELVQGFGSLFSSLFDEQKKSTKEVLKDVLLITLKFAEQQVQIAALTANTQAAIQAVANPILLAKLALQKGIITALIGAAFGALRGIVSNFEEGGIIKDGVPFKQPGTSDNVLIHAKKGEVVLNEKQQSKIRSLAGDGIFSQAGVKGFKRSATNQKVVMQNNNSVNAISNLSPESIDQLSRSVALAIVDKNRGVERLIEAGIM